jgi:hypothetical protein
MMSLPVHQRWLHEIDVMLEKQKGVRKVHLLRIIGLLEADFNTALKFFFARKMMQNAECNGLSDEQWGSRRNRSSLDAAMIKLLMFETARIKKTTLAATYYDLVANYDRIKASISNLMAQRHMVDKNVLRARALVLERMRRHVKTGLGTSTETYGNEKGDKDKVDGEVQGKGDVPPFWCAQSDTLLRAHSRRAFGMCIYNPTKTRRIQRCNTQFIDDCDGWTNAPHYVQDQESVTMERLWADAQRWNNLNNIPGQTIAFQKTKWQILAWEVLKGDLQIKYTTDHTLVLEDNKGGVALIEFLAPDQPNKGLGYRLCPDGNQGPHFKALYDSVAELCSAISGAQLSEKEARQALWQRLLPKLDYGLHASYFSKQQCKQMDCLINSTFLPPMRLNRNTPRAIIHGPLRYGGLELADTRTRQTQLHVKDMIKYLRWDQTVGGDILTALDNLQLASGFVTPILQATDKNIDYIDQGWILDLRKRLNEIGASMWIEQAWQPPLQREGDLSLMEQFLLVHSTPKQRRQLRQVLHWLQVITLADLVDPTGHFIPEGRLTGDWQAKSNLEWPRQPRPDKAAFATFRLFLRNTIFVKTSLPGKNQQHRCTPNPSGGMV